MDRSCDGGKTDDGHQRQPWLLLLLAGVGIFTRASRTALAAEAALAVATEAAVAVTSETAFTLATEAAAAIVTLAVAIGFPHHRRRTFLELFDANAEVTDH